MELSAANLTIAVAALVALVYGALFLGQPESPSRSVLKTLPLAILSAAALALGINPLLAFGLAACAAGDWFLSREGERPFLYGLSAFLLGHLFYVGFFSAGLPVDRYFTTDMGFLAIILAALAASVLIRIWPHVDGLRGPVLAYAAVICLMAFVARAANPGQIVLAGVALFLISDILLAQDKFTPLTNSAFRKAMPWIIWTTYAGGQILIVYGVFAGAGLL